MECELVVARAAIVYIVKVDQVIDSERFLINFTLGLLHEQGSVLVVATVLRDQFRL